MEIVNALGELGKFPIRIVTHNGIAHADDMLACATLQAASRGAAIGVLRTRGEKEILDAVSDPRITVVDIGGVYDPSNSNFDHHMKSPPSRPGGLPYSSFGLVAQLLEVEDTDFHRHVDAVDNGKFYPSPSWWPLGRDAGGKLQSVARTIHDCSPVSDGKTRVADKVFDDRFLQLVDMFSALFTEWGSLRSVPELANVSDGIVRRLSPWLEAHDMRRSESVRRVRKMLSGHKGPILVLHRYEAGACDAIAEKPADYPVRVLIYRGQSQWFVQAIPTEVGSTKTRWSFPRDWRGLDRRDLLEATGIDGFRFCHRKGFICGADTLEAAKKIADASRQQWMLT